MSQDRDKWCRSAPKLTVSKLNLTRFLSKSNLTQAVSISWQGFSKRRCTWSFSSLHLTWSTSLETKTSRTSCKNWITLRNFSRSKDVSNLVRSSWILPDYSALWKRCKKLWHRNPWLCILVVMVCVVVKYMLGKLSHKRKWKTTSSLKTVRAAANLSDNLAWSKWLRIASVIWISFLWRLVTRSLSVKSFTKLVRHMSYASSKTRRSRMMQSLLSLVLSTQCCLCRVRRFAARSPRLKTASISSMAHTNLISSRCYWETTQITNAKSLGHSKVGTTT